MAEQLTVTLPDNVLKQIEKQAQAENRLVNELVVDVLQNSFAPMPENPEQEAMDREMAAYQNLHPNLLAQYKGQFVAVYRGQVVDNDSNQLALVKRRLKKYPNETVLITQVRQEPVRTLRIRSPRLVRLTS